MRIQASPGRRLLQWLVGALVLLAPGLALAGGGKPATRLVNVADTRAMEPGLGKFLADTYNEDLLLYAVLVVVIMAGMGAVLGFTFDRLVTMFGINLGKLDHHE